MSDLITSIHKASRLALSTTIPVELKAAAPYVTPGARRWLHIVNPNAGVIFLGSGPTAAECIVTLQANVPIPTPFNATNGIYALASVAAQNVEILEGW